jgi:ABC-type cobalt transport system substrate-binding protein
MHELMDVIFAPPSHTIESWLFPRKTSAIPSGIAGFFLDIGTIGWFSVI